MNNDLDNLLQHIHEHFRAPNLVEAEIQLLDARVGLPERKTPGSAGYDLRAAISEPLVLGPNETAMVSTGIAVWLNNPGFEVRLLPRSGKGSKGLVLGNLEGTVDSDYQGPIKLCLWNRTNEPMTIQPLEEVAQMIISPVYQAKWKVVETFGGETVRGDGGFGSTDKKES